jgi:hypothetical protein
MGQSAEIFSSCRGHSTAQYSIIYFKINGPSFSSKNSLKKSSVQKGIN